MMAATIQTPAQQRPPTATNDGGGSPATTPQLKRIVYSKYRELLGSYNDKANAIIESLPAYMVKEDRGFHFDPKIIDEVDKVVYGTPPAPPPLSTGSVPSQRLSTQMPQYNVGEAPACVQNAMMTKDKKPFTYTPGGIDLSQIKSQRMAKRLARNAQIEGATGQQQLNRPSPSPQQQSNGGTSPAAQLGATAMGMPFQVLPTGPPPPPPQPSNKGGAPPPPPPAPQNKLNLQSNGNAAHARKSPTPQNFEPPPMGFRPEIKIPPNPMATLKKVPPPQEKNNFWVEEYRKERSKSPMVGNDENDYNRSPPNNPQSETNQYTQNNNYNNSQQQIDYQQPQQQNQYRSPSPQPMRPEYSTQRAPSPPRTPVQPLDQQRRTENPYQTQYSPQPQPQQQQQQQPSIQRQLSSQNQPQYQSPQQSSPQQQSPPIQRQQIVPPQQYQGPTSPQYQQQQTTSPTQSVPWRQPRNVASVMQNNVSRPRDVMSPAPSESPRPQSQQQQMQQQQQLQQQLQQQQQQLQQQQYPAYLRSREVLSPGPELQPPQMSQPYQQKNAQVGSIYIPPVAPQQQTSSYQEAQGVRQQQQQPVRQAPANRWVSQQPQPVAAESQPLNRIKSPPPPQASNGFGSSNNNTGLRLQINSNTSSASGKERVIPIQLEQTPTPTRTPQAPGFGPQPFYNANQQQYSSVPSPPLAQGATSNGQNSPSYIVRSPNQFVDQGYNNYPGSQDPNRVTSPTMQQMQSPRIVQQTNTAGGVKTRVIPIAIDAQPDGALNPNNVRGPIIQQPLVIQNDPRNQNSWGNGSATPNQSKSFRILQKITDTTDDGVAESKVIETDIGDQEPQLQRPTYARQMGPGQVNSPTIEQMKRMQLNNEQGLANRARIQENNEEPGSKAANEDPRYLGPSNPSKTFKKLQGAVERCVPITITDKDGTSPVMKQPQPTRYVNQRPVYSSEEPPQPYVHPSEQQVPEPKKYTGSAIPSRTFKILQAMTTPENAAEMEGSDVVETNKPITECPYHQLPPPNPAPGPYAYSYPYLPPCCPPPPPNFSSDGGDVHNWQYPSHPHPHPHPHSHPHAYHPHPHHPYPPCPYYYYYPPNEYDSQCQGRDAFNSRGSSLSHELPDIIITPSADDIPQLVGGQDRGVREGSVIDTLSRRLSEIAKPAVDVDLNMSQADDKEYVGDGGKEFNNSPSPIKSECENNKVSSEESSDDLLTSSSDDTTTSSSEDHAEQEHPKDGLQAIKSVTNIQVYNQKTLSPMNAYDDDLTVAEGESMIFDEEEEEDEIVGDELEYDEEEVLVEEMDSEDEEALYEDDEEEEEEVVVMDDLSVIYEENEADIPSPRPASRISSSVSDSTTLANDDCYEEHEEVIKEEEDEDNSNSVTVRLPLKFSFSRSSNDENIATVEVGNSQIEDKRRSFSIASVEVDPEEDASDSQDCDVSVTISLSPSSGSFDRKSSLSPVPRRLEAVVNEEIIEDEFYESEAEDVSVSLSLPMRNKFLDRTWNGDITNNIAEKKNKNQMEEDAAVEAWRSSCVFEEKIEDERINQAAGETEIEAADDFEKKEEEKGENVEEELDFWATLQATRKEAQLFLEKTANYWGKKVDEQKAVATPQQEQEKPVETQTDSEFWASIRVKDKPIEEVVPVAPEEVEAKKETKPKVAKTKKKKKIVKAPEKEPEPEHVWSTINLPNANNRAKIVESTIKMIQNKTTSKKTKEAKKPMEKEIEVGDFVASIKVAYDKEEMNEKVGKESMPSPKAGTPSDKKKMEREKSEDNSLSIIVTNDKKQEDDIRSKLVREKAELKTQILNQKFAKAFVIPEKLPLMRAILSEVEPEVVVFADSKTLISSRKASTSSVETLVSVTEAWSSRRESMETSKVGQKWEFSAKISNPISYEAENAKVEIVIEESAKVEKPKKKVTKSKKVVEESEGDTLKLPKVKRASKELKKIKKKKQESVEEPVAVEAKQEVDENLSPTVTVKETDFWADNQSSKESQAVEDSTQDISELSVKQSESASWMVIESSSIKNEEEPQVESQEIDFWSEINQETSAGYEEQNLKIETVYTSPVVETPSEDIDFWAEIEIANARTASVQTRPVESVQEGGTWGQAEESPKVHESTEFWSAIDASKNEEEKSVLADIWAPAEVADVSKEMAAAVDIWAPAAPTNVNGETLVVADIWTPTELANANSHQETDFWAEISANKQEEPKAEVFELSPVPKKKSIDTDVTALPKPKSKKKVKKTDEKKTTPKEQPEEVDSGVETSKIKSKKKTKDESPDETAKLKTKKKSSIPKMDASEIDFWAEIETSKRRSANRKSSTLHVYGEYDVELINLETVPTFYAVHTQPKVPLGYWATISNFEEFPAAKIDEERECDFWASNSSGNETEVNSEVDTGKIDFWETQRKFETNSAFATEATPKKEEEEVEETEEIDFWAEIKGPNSAEDEAPTVVTKDECEVRRNNYKKAMAFFTSTVNVEKKEESPMPTKNSLSTPVQPLHNSWGWRESVEHDWEAPEECEVNDVFLIVEDSETKNEPDTLVEGKPCEMGESFEFEAIEDEQIEEEASESSESISDSTPNHFQIEHQYPKPEPEPIKQLEKPVEPILNKFGEEIKISVKDRIFAFESGTTESPPQIKSKTTLIVSSSGTPKSNLSRNSSQRSESEVEEDDSGVTDMNKLLSETDTESESFPELRKMTRYQRASTHSRLFKLLQDDGDVIEEEQPSADDKALEAEFNFKPRKKIVHNVSITRKQNPKALQEAESMTQRRERLSLPLRKNASIDADNLSSPNSPASPIFGQPSQAVSDKLVNELVQSLLLKKSSSTLKNLPMEKLQAAAKRVLEEELDSLENTSLDSTPALTPQEFKSESYSDYYDSWSAKTDSDTTMSGENFDILPSKAFKALQDTSATTKRRPWAVRCPRVLSSKTVNRDLARVTESPEILSRSSNSPEVMFGGSERGSSVGRWRKV